MIFNRRYKRLREDINKARAEDLGSILMMLDPVIKKGDEVDGMKVLDVVDRICNVCVGERYNYVNITYELIVKTKKGEHYTHTYIAECRRIKKI